MRTLKFAILGLLLRNPMSGYDITKEFNGELAEFWSAKHSQIYPELKKLLEEGLLTYNIEINGEVLEKKVYSITKKGREEFLKWLDKKEDMESTPKSVFRLKMYFSNNLDIDKRIELLEHELMQHGERLAFLQGEMGKYKEVPQIDSEEIGDYFVLSGAVMRESANIKWLESCIEICRKNINN